MGVEGSCGVVEGFLKYVSNYNRKMGLAVLCGFVVLNRIRRCKASGEALFFNALNGKFESSFVNE